MFNKDTFRNFGRIFSLRKHNLRYPYNFKQLVFNSVLR